MIVRPPKCHVFKAQGLVETGERDLKWKLAHVRSCDHVCMSIPYRNYKGPGKLITIGA